MTDASHSPAPTATAGKPDANPDAARFAQLQSLIRRLRGPGGCPWDREQTLQGLGIDLLDEAIEAQAAIANDDMAELKEELGDVIWAAIMTAEIAQEQGLFSVDESMAAACAKLVHRHPHIFGDQKAGNAEEALTIFYAQKAKEGRKPKERLSRGSDAHQDSMAAAEATLRDAFVAYLRDGTIEQLADLAELCNVVAAHHQKDLSTVRDERAKDAGAYPLPGAVRR